MIKLTTAARLIWTVAVVCLLAQKTAWAETVFNFVGNSPGRVIITNTSDAPADVEFTLYDTDGNSVAGLPNPVRLRVSPRKQLTLMSHEIFPSNARLPSGWIQATSPADGLRGTFLTGDLLRTFEATGGLIPIVDQVVPYTIPGTAVVLTNPDTASVQVSLRFYNSNGGLVGAERRDLLAPHAQLRVSAPTDAASARIISEAPILVMGILQRPDQLTVIEGQNTSVTSSWRVIPHFEAPTSRLVLTNFGAAPVTVDATLFSDESGEALTQKITVPPNGTVATGWPAAVAGWIGLRSNVVSGLSVLTVVEAISASTAFAPQATQLERLVFPWTGGEGFPQRFATIADGDTRVTFHLIRADGTVVAEQNVRLSARERRTIALSELFPHAGGQHGGYVIAEASRPLYAAALVYDPLGDSSSTMPLQHVPPGFVVADVRLPPVFVRMESATEISRGVMRLRIAMVDDRRETALVIGHRKYPLVRESTPSVARFYADIPLPEPGLIAMRLRAGDAESEPITVAIRPSGMGVTTTLRGRAYFQKIPVSDAGLGTARPWMVPIRNARVEVTDSATRQLLSVSETDDLGNFQVLAPESPGLTIRVLSQLRFQNLRVLDNTNGNQAYAVSTQVDMRDPNRTLFPLELIDRSHVSGAFNILDAIQRGNDLLFQAAGVVPPPDVTIFWSERNTDRPGDTREGLVGRTHFDLQTNTAYVLGDRSHDSDEYDDSVLLHEYAHFLAAQFSRDDSPGGPHGLGDLLDPRLAWSEGWANFFSAAVLQSPIYRDTRSADQAVGLRYDLEENVPPGDRPGYRSEASIQSLLWDLIDDNADLGDTARFPFSTLWAAFTDLRSDRFVYLPSFLDRFRARNPDFADALRIMGHLRGIDFQPQAIPSMSNPFPKPILMGEIVEGEVDSLTARRANLAQSAHFYAFTLSDISNVTIGLQIRGLGPANDPGLNDLDLFLLDADGIRLQQSERGLNGQSELIPSVRLAAGTYIIEIRSFYTRSETNTTVYNSGGYRLEVQAR